MNKRILDRAHTGTLNPVNCSQEYKIVVIVLNRFCRFLARENKRMKEESKQDKNIPQHKSKRRCFRHDYRHFVCKELNKHLCRR